MKSKQLLLGGRASEFKEYWKETGRKVHGGEHALGKRKTARPFTPKKAMHVVMRSEKARGSLSFRRARTYGKVIEVIRRHAKAGDLKIYNLSVNSNHLHFLIRAKTRASLQKFLRSVTGHLARLVTGAARGVAKGKFWDGLAFTRIVEWGSDFGKAQGYVVQNVLESAGIVEYRPRDRRTKSKLRSSA